MNHLKKQIIVVCAVAAVAVMLTAHYAAAQGTPAGGGRAPLPLRLSEPIQPVFANGACDSDEQVNNCQSILYTVPAGKRLVVEYFSGLANLPFVGQTARMWLNVSPSTVPGGVPEDTYLPLLPPAAQSVFVGTSRGITSIGQTIRLYAGPSSIVKAVVLRSTGDGRCVFSFQISGHLENVAP